MRDQAEIKELHKRCEALQHVTVAKDRESERVMHSMKVSHKQAASQLGRLYERKLEYESDRYAELQTRKVMLEEQVSEITAQTERLIFQDQEHFEKVVQRQLAEKDLEIQRHKGFITFAQHRFDDMTKREGDVHDHEINDMKNEAFFDLERQKRTEEKLRVEQDTLVKGLEMMERDKEKLERELHEAEMTKSGLKTQTEELERTVQSLEVERRDRESTLVDKESKIESYQVKVSTLKKFKHVLDKRLKEITHSLQPKDEMIQQLDKHLSELEKNFEQQLVDHREMESQIDQKKQHIDWLSSEEKKLQETIEDKDRSILRYTSDLSKLVTETPDMRIWPREIRRMYHTHVLGERAAQDRMPVEEVQREMRMVERKVNSLTVKGDMTNGKCKSDTQRKAHENGMLVHQLNELRVQKHSLHVQLRSLQVKFGQEEQKLVDRQALPPRPVAAPSPAAVVRTPSGGALPGPRQSSSQGKLEIYVPPGKPQSVPPLSAATRKAPAAHSRDPRGERLSSEEQKRMQALMLTTELNGRQMEVQAIENKFLRDQIGKLLDGGTTSDAAIDTMTQRPRANDRSASPFAAPVRAAAK